jgi:hypothetical protein
MSATPARIIRVGESAPSLRASIATHTHAASAPANAATFSDSPPSAAEPNTITSTAPTLAPDDTVADWPDERVWGELDRRLARCDYSDVAILGKAVTRKSGWWPVGLALHAVGGHHGPGPDDHDPGPFIEDPPLTDRFITEFTACMAEHGILVDNVGASVSTERALAFRGYSATGGLSEDDPGTDCENALMNQLDLPPYIDGP